MNLLEQIHLIQQLDQLIRLKATGTPKELADRINLSERHLYRLLDEMRAMGFPIVYSKQRQSYCYENPIRFSFEVCALDDKEKGKTTGGQNYFDFFSKLTDYGSRAAEICGS